ncbi:unnamed protein product, partial [Scytosiphon promiscuus]
VATEVRGEVKHVLHFMFLESKENEFVSNMVRTAKFEYYDFLPRFLWEEFNPATKIANVYFLFIAALQVIPSITNTFGLPLMLLPLFFVVCVDAIFMVRRNTRAV